MEKAIVKRVIGPVVDIPVSAVATVGTVTGIFPALAYAFDGIGSLGHTKSETQN